MDKKELLMAINKELDEIHEASIDTLKREHYYKLDMFKITSSIKNLEILRRKIMEVSHQFGEDDLLEFIKENSKKTDGGAMIFNMSQPEILKKLGGSSLRSIATYMQNLSEKKKLFYSVFQKMDSENNWVKNWGSNIYVTEEQDKRDMYEIDGVRLFRVLSKHETKKNYWE